MQSLSRAQEFGTRSVRARCALTGAWTRSVVLQEAPGRDRARSGAPVADLTDRYGQSEDQTTMPTDMASAIRRLFDLVRNNRNHSAGCGHRPPSVATSLALHCLVRIIAVPCCGSQSMCWTRLGQPVLVDGRELRLSATMGVALWPQDAGSMDELISNADLALYKGKKQGRALAVAFGSRSLG